MSGKSERFFTIASLLITIIVVLAVTEACHLHRSRPSSTHHNHPGRRSHRNLTKKSVQGYKLQDNLNRHPHRSVQAEIMSSARRKRHDEVDRFEKDIFKMGNTSLCEYKAYKDYMKGRNPEVIINVYCQSRKSCGTHDSTTYYCTQAFAEIDIQYDNGTKQKDKVRMGCLCAPEKLDTIVPEKPTKGELDD